MNSNSPVNSAARPAGLRAMWVEINGERLLMLSHPLEIPPAVGPFPGLTPAEQEIAAGVVAGRSNAEIAAQRGTSPRTVAKQLERIYERLGVSSRAELCVRSLSTKASAAR